MRTRSLTHSLESSLLDNEAKKQQQKTVFCAQQSVFGSERVMISTLMSWWTTLFAICSSAAWAAFKQHTSSLCCMQGAQRWVWVRPAIRCRVMGLFVQLRAQWVERGSPGEKGRLHSLSLGPKSHPVQDKGLSLCPSETARPPRPCRETGLCNRIFATRGMKFLTADVPWCMGVPGPSTAKSASMQRSSFKDRILLGQSSRDATESLRKRLYLVRFSMPAGVVLITSTAQGSRGGWNLVQILPFNILISGQRGKKM